MYLGKLALDADLLFPALIAAGALAGYFLRGTRADTLLAAAMVTVISVYLLTSYGTITAV